MKLSLAYLKEDTQILRHFELNSPCTLRQAIEHTGILRECPEINLAINKVGVFNKIVSLGTQLQAGDRIEIYRALKLSPMEARRLRSKGRLD